VKAGFTMWILTGPFDGDEADNPRPHKSKLLKSGNTYTMGRRDQALTIKDKKISREHARFYVGECSVNDAMNADFVPTLSVEILKSNSKKNISRNMDRSGKDSPYVLNPGEAAQVMDGDVIHMVTGVPVAVRWEKVCCYSPPKNSLSHSLEACAALGVRIVHKLGPNVTHHLSPSFTLSPEIATSLVFLATLVKPEWLIELLRRGQSENDAPSALEQSFILPPTNKYRPSFSPSLPVALKSFVKWEANEGRIGIFRDIRFVFIGEKGREIQEAMRELVKRGEGDYECFTVESGRHVLHQVLAKGRGKGRQLVLVADEKSVVPAVGADGWQELLDEARRYENDGFASFFVWLI